MEWFIFNTLSFFQHGHLSLWDVFSVCKCWIEKQKKKKSFFLFQIRTIVRLLVVWGANYVIASFDQSINYSPNLPKKTTKVHAFVDCWTKFENSFHFNFSHDILWLIDNFLSLYLSLSFYVCFSLSGMHQCLWVYVNFTSIYANDHDNGLNHYEYLQHE